MATFAPTGPSMIVQLSANQQQRVELPDIEGEAKALRLLATAHPSSTAYAFVALGDEAVEVSQQNGMALDLTARKEQIIGLTGEPSNLALAMSVTSGSYTVCITPGVLVA